MTPAPPSGFKLDQPVAAPTAPPAGFKLDNPSPPQVPTPPKGFKLDAPTAPAVAPAPPAPAPSPHAAAYQKAAAAGRPPQVLDAIKKLMAQVQSPPPPPRSFSDDAVADPKYKNYLAEVPDPVRRDLEGKADAPERIERMVTGLDYVPKIKPPKPPKEGDVETDDPARLRYDASTALEAQRRAALRAGDVEAGDRYRGWLEALEEEDRGAIVMPDRKPPREVMEKAATEARAGRDVEMRKRVREVIERAKREDDLETVTGVLAGDKGAVARFLESSVGRHIMEDPEIRRLTTSGRKLTLDDIGTTIEGPSGQPVYLRSRSDIEGANRFNAQKEKHAAALAENPIDFLRYHRREDLITEEMTSLVDEARSPERVAAVERSVARNWRVIEDAADTAVEKYGRVGDAELALVLRKALEYQRFLAVRPERSAGQVLSDKWDGGEGAKRAVTLGIYEATELADLQKQMRQIVEGEPDKTAIAAFVAKGIDPKQAEALAAQGQLKRVYEALTDMAERTSPATFMGNVSQVVADMPEFMAAFALSGRAGKSVQQGAAAHAKDLIGGTIKRSFSPAMSGMFLKGGMQEALGNLVEGETETNLAAALAKTFGESVVEVFSEQTGSHVFGPAFGKLSTKLRLDAVAKGIEKEWTRVVGRRTGKAFKDALREVGYDGVISEMLEERVSGLLKGEGLPTLEQLAVEGVAFSALPGAQVVAGQTIGKALEGRERREQKAAADETRDQLAALREVPGNEDLTRKQVVEMQARGEEIPGASGLSADQGPLQPVTLSPGAAAGLTSFQEDANKATGQGLDLEAVQAHTMGEREAQRRAEKLGIEIVFVRDKGGKQLDRPGYHTAPDGKSVLYVAAGEENMATMGLFFHEWTHALEKNDAPAFKSLVDQLRKAAPDVFDSATRSYFADGEAASDQKRTSEGVAVVAEILVDQIINRRITKRQLVNAAKAKPGLWRRILQTIDRVLATMGVRTRGAAARAKLSERDKHIAQGAAAVLAFRNAIAGAVGKSEASKAGRDWAAGGKTPRAGATAQAPTIEEPGAFEAEDDSPAAPGAEVSSNVFNKAANDAYLEEQARTLPSLKDQADTIIAAVAADEERNLGHDAFAVTPDDVEHLRPADRARLAQMIPIGDDAIEIRDIVGEQLYEDVIEELLGGMKGRVERLIDSVLADPAGQDPELVLRAWMAKRWPDLSEEQRRAKPLLLDPETLPLGATVTVLGEPFEVAERGGDKFLRGEFRSEPLDIFTAVVPVDQGSIEFAGEEALPAFAKRLEEGLFEVTGADRRRASAYSEGEPSVAFAWGVKQFVVEKKTQLPEVPASMAVDEARRGFEAAVAGASRSARDDMRESAERDRVPDDGQLAMFAKRFKDKGPGLFQQPSGQKEAEDGDTRAPDESRDVAGGDRERDAAASGDDRGSGVAEPGGAGAVEPAVPPVVGDTGQAAGDQPGDVGGVTPRKPFREMTLEEYARFWKEEEARLALETSGRKHMTWEEMLPEVRTHVIKGYEKQYERMLAREAVGTAVMDEAPDLDAESRGGKITDFGAKITGARKDYAQLLRDAGDVDVASVPLSVSWPEPDYEKLLEGGTTPETVALIRAARDGVPAKPQRSWKLKKWVDTVALLRKLAAMSLRGEISPTQQRTTLTSSELIRPGITDRRDLYLAVGHGKSLKGVRIAVGSYSVYNGQHFDKAKVVWSVEREAKSSPLSNWPRQLASGATRDEAIAKFKAAYATIDTQPAAEKQVSFSIYSYRTGPKAGKVYIGKKIGTTYFDLKSFESSAEARAYLTSNRAELEAMLDRLKEIPSERKTSNSPRVGADHRNGADATPRAFEQAFGFRGVQFGNYVENSRRQQDLNEAYDALMDLAGVLEIPTRALSLNGELGLAFGSRGRGGKRAPSAHYEAVQVVINLTKQRGAGSLAHEWWHALDNYFARMGGSPRSFATDKPGLSDGAVRPEMVEAFDQVMQAIKGTDLQKRSRELDRRRTSPYWGTGIEMSARSFESYVVAKLQDQGAANDYLANIVTEDYWKAEAALGLNDGAEARPSYPYPVAAEVPAIRGAFDHFFRVVETRSTTGEEGSDRVGMFARRFPQRPRATGTPLFDPSQVKESAAKPADPGAVGRFKSTEPMVFKTPVRGPSGAELISYDWAWRPEEFIDRTGDEKVRRVSDWDRAETSAQTGRDLVHKFVVRTGGVGEKERTVSLESAVKELGFSTAEQAKPVRSLANALKRVAERRLRVQAIEQEAAALAVAEGELDQVTPPAIVRDGSKWRMGDAVVWDTSGAEEIPDERQRVLVDAWRRKRLSEKGFERGAGDLAFALETAREALVAAEARVASELEAAANAKPAGVFAPVGKETDAPITEVSSTDQPAEKREYSSTQIDLDGAVADRLLELSRSIPDDMLAGDGRETEPHITVKYGLHTDDAADLEKLLAGEKPIAFTLGEISIFPAKEATTQRGGDQYDVVKVDIESPDLHRLNAKIADALEHTDTFPVYKPHATIAYVKAGEGERIAKSLPSVEGMTGTAASITFSGQSRQMVDVPLGEFAKRFADKGPGLFGDDAVTPELPAKSHNNVDLNDVVAASRRDGAVHLDEVPDYVELLRGKRIRSLRNGSTGVVQTVANDGHVVVRWDDESSALENSGSKRSVKPRGKRKAIEVWESVVFPGDRFEFVVEGEQRPPQTVAEAREEAMRRPDQGDGEFARRRESDPPFVADLRQRYGLPWYQSATLPKIMPGKPGSADFTAGTAAVFAQQLPGGETAAGKALIAAIDGDKEGKVAGLRQIVDMLAEAMDVEIREGRLGTSMSNPASFQGEGWDLIRTRAGAWQVNFHELGHALGDWIESVSPAGLFWLQTELVKVGNLKGSFATKVPDGNGGWTATPEEGMAEWLRRFVWKADTVPNHVTNAIMAILDSRLPALAGAVRDAHRAVQAHSRRDIRAQTESYKAGTRTPLSVSAQAGIVQRWWHWMIYFAVSGNHPFKAAVVDPVFKLLSRHSPVVGKALRDKLVGTGADVRNIAQAEYHLGQEVTRAIYGHDDPGAGNKNTKGLRLRLSGSFTTSAAGGKAGGANPIPRILASLPANLVARFIARFHLGNMVRGSDRHGEFLYLTDFDVQDVIEAVTRAGKDNARWDLFDWYVVHREYLNRYKDRFDVFDGDGNFVETFEDEKLAKARLAQLNAPTATLTGGTPPANLATIKKREGLIFPGATEDLVGKIQVELDAIDRANPDFEGQRKRLNTYMDQTVLAAVIMGRFNGEEAMRIVGAREEYAPLLREVPAGTAESRAAASARAASAVRTKGTEPDAGIRRAFGSALPALPLLESVETRVRELLEGYYRNRTGWSVFELGEAIAKEKGAPEEVVHIARRAMAPVPMKWQAAATMTEEEKAAFLSAAAKAINESRAQAAGVPVDQLPAADVVDPSKINVELPGGGVLWRQAKPTGAVNLIGLWRDGKQQFFEVADPMLFDWFARSTAPNVVAKTLNLLFRPIYEALRRPITQNWVFAIKNVVARDPFTALQYGEDGAAKYVPYAYAGIALADRLRGGNGTPGIQEMEMFSRSLEALNSRRHRSRFDRFWSSFKDVVTEGFVVPGWKDMGWLERATQLSMNSLGFAVEAIVKPLNLLNYITGSRAASQFGEGLNRRGAYIAALAGGKGQEAAQAAADRVTGNFIATPGNASTAAWYRAAMFFNPNVQTLYQLYEQLTDPTISRSSKLKTGVVFTAVVGTKMVIIGTYGGAMIALLAFAMMDDDDKERERQSTEEERLTHMRIPLPGSNVAVRLPFPYGFEGATASTSYNLTMKALLGEGMQDGVRGTEMARQAIERAAAAPEWSSLLTPMGQIAYDLARNKDSFSGRAITPAYVMDRYPDNPELWSTSGTPEWAEWLSEKLDVPQLVIGPFKFPRGATEMAYAARRLKAEAVTAAPARVISAFSEGGGGWAELLAGQEPSDTFLVGPLLAREPRGFNSAAVDSAQVLAAEFDAAKAKLDKAVAGLAEGDDPDADPRVRAAVATMERTAAGASAMKVIEKIWRAVKFEKGKPHPDRAQIAEWERMMTEVAKAAQEQ